MGFFEAAATEVSNFMKLFSARRASEFFALMEIKPANYMFKYLAFAGLFLIAGYALNIFYKMGFGEAETKCPLVVAIESSVLLYLVLLLAVAVVGYILPLFGKSLAGRDIDADEVVSVLAYPLSFILVSGIFRAHVYTLVLHYLAIMYAIYLLYEAIAARFGIDRSMVVFLFFLIVSSIAFLVLFWVTMQSFNLSIGVLKMVGLQEIDIPIKTISPWCH